MYNKNYVQTCYYDYYTLKKSIETSKILKESYIFELAEVLECDKNNTQRIEEIRKCIYAQERIIAKQEELLNDMQKAFDEFPKQLIKVEDEVFHLRVVQNKDNAIIAKKLGYTGQYIRLITSKILDKFADYTQTIDSFKRLQ